MSRNRGKMLSVGSVNMNLAGHKELVSVLKNMESKVALKMNAQALNFATGPVVTQTRRNIRAAGLKGTGLLEKSIGKKTIKYKNGAVAVAIIGARKSFEAKGKDGQVFKPSALRKPAKYFHLIEFGTKARDVTIHAKWGPDGRLYIVGKHRAEEKGVLTYSAKHPGTKAHHVLERAFDSKKNEVRDRYWKRMWTLIERQAAKNAKR